LVLGEANVQEELATSKGNAGGPREIWDAALPHDNSTVTRYHPGHDLSVVIVSKKEIYAILVWTNKMRIADTTYSENSIHCKRKDNGRTTATKRRIERNDERKKE
jgi:hypothetical protein